MLEYHDDVGLTAWVHTHLVTLTQLFATERLTALAQAEQYLDWEPPNQAGQPLDWAGRSATTSTRGCRTCSRASSPRRPDPDPKSSPASRRLPGKALRV